MLAAIPADEDIRRKSAKYEIIGRPGSAWGSLFEELALNVATAPLWRAEVPGHNVVIMPGTGHCPMIERPGESVALVLTWWRSKMLLHAP